VGDLVRRATEAGKSLATLAIDTEVRFRSATDRAAFTSEPERFKGAEALVQERQWVGVATGEAAQVGKEIPQVRLRWREFARRVGGHAARRIGDHGLRGQRCCPSYLSQKSSSGRKADQISHDSAILTVALSHPHVGAEPDTG
jgi:hypothetical protein